MLQLKSSTHQITTSSTYKFNFQYVCCCSNRLALLILSLLCTIIVLTEQAVASVIPTQAASASSFPFNESLVVILPQVNPSSNSRLASVLERQSSFNQTVDVLTPGQQVINAVPYKERTDFMLYQVTVGLKRMYDNEAQRRLFKNLDDLQKFYKSKLTTLKNVPVYENFSTDLLHWLGQEFSLNHQRLYTQMRGRTEIWCNSQGVCYGYSGVGCYCCPF